MDKTAKQVALIEIGGSHDECLYAQLAVLKHAGYTVHLIIDEKLAQRIGNDAAADHTKVISFGKSRMGDWRSLFAIKNYLAQNKIPKAVINTAEGKLVRNLSIIIDRSTEVTGILHNGKKLEKSGTQKVISWRIKKYFVLNDYILEPLKKNVPKGIQLESFYPVFFPKLKPQPIPGKGNEFRVCIPGQLELKRRDYTALLQALYKLKDQLPENIKFILLGNGSHAHGNGPEIKAQVKEMGLESHFVFFDSFISNDLFYTYLVASDIILPLIHPQTDGFENYLRYQISGTYNLAFGFAKPMLVHEAFKNIEDLQKCAWFYKTEEIAEKIVKMARQKELLIQKEKEIAATEKFGLEYQGRKYINFLEAK